MNYERRISKLIEEKVVDKCSKCGSENVRCICKVPDPSNCDNKHFKHLFQCDDCKTVDVGHTFKLGMGW